MRDSYMMLNGSHSLSHVILIRSNVLSRDMSSHVTFNLSHHCPETAITIQAEGEEDLMSEFKHIQGR